MSYVYTVGPEEEAEIKLALSRALKERGNDSSNP